MSDLINDDNAEAIPVSAMPKTWISTFRQLATTGRFSFNGGAEQMGSQFLYPFYGGKKTPDVTVSDPFDYWGTVKTTIHRDAAQLGPGQCAIVIINAAPTTLTVTRPYRDGGYMLRYPVDEANKAGVIAGVTTMDGVDTIGVGGFVNDCASIFYGSGAVLALTPSDSSFQTMLIGYGTSVNGGGGLRVSADKSLVPDAEAWFKKYADNSSFPAGSCATAFNSKLRITASYAPWDKLDSNRGGVFTVLIEPT